MRMYPESQQKPDNYLLCFQRLMPRTCVAGKFSAAQAFISAGAKSLAWWFIAMGTGLQQVL